MALSQQLSLRLSPQHRQMVRDKMEELRNMSPTPIRVTEADAIRTIIEQASSAQPQLKESLNGQ